MRRFPYEVLQTTVARVRKISPPMVVGCETRCWFYCATQAGNALLETASYSGNSILMRQMHDCLSPDLPMKLSDYANGQGGNDRRVCMRQN